jgi:RNA polymerase-binding transcription factor DksA
MAAKKISKKSVAKKATKNATPKPANKPAPKKAAPVKKAVKKAVAPEKAVKKAAPAKKVEKKAVKKAAPAKKATPAKKAAPAKAAPKKEAPKKAAPAKAAKAIAPQKAPTKKAAPKKEAKAKKPTLVNVPPPAAAKPKFVPPKAVPVTKSSAGTGSHTAAFIEKQHQRLLDLRDSLVDSMTGMTRDTIRNAPEGSEASGSGQHQGDAGSDAYDRDFALSVLANEQDALYEIEQALRRIKGGTYGNCEISEKKIPIARLEAIPFARLTVECQAQWEKEYGNRRFRPSNEVGFSGGAPQEDEDSVTVSLDGDDD